MKLGSFSKQPSEKISLSIKYDKALDAGDELKEVLFCTVVPADELQVFPILAGTKRVRLFTEEGLDTAIYKITLRVLTSNGEEFEDEIICKVNDK